MYADEKAPDAKPPANDRQTVKVYERILDLLEAEGIRAVFGIPDERWGERVVAVAVERTGEALDPDEVVAWCAGRLAGFKRPRQVLVVDALPTNASGKVLKREVRLLAAQHLA